MMRTLKSLDDANRAYLEQKARANPGAWVYEIDFDYLPDQRTPPEAIKGAWEVDPSGHIKEKFQPNPNYRPIQLSDRQLKPYMHVGARSYPGYWITEVAESAEHLFPQAPEDKVRGWWLVDNNGKITQEFRPNSKFRE